MIRHAVPGDKPALIAMAARFHEAVPAFAAHPFSKVAAARTAHAHIGMPGAVLLVLDLGGIKGALVAHIQPMPFSEAKVAREVAFWIDPDARGEWGRKMVAKYEAWAAGQGAAMVGLSALDDRTVAAFTRMGFEARETTLVKGR